MNHAAHSYEQSRSDALLRERERLGVKTLTIVRGLFVLIVVVSVTIIGASLFEKIATAAIGALVFGVILISLYFLARNRFVRLIGLVGCLLDVSVLALLPVVWYFSVGGPEVPPAYMLKTQVTPLVLVIVAVNALAIRPLYPLIAAAGGICIEAGLLTYVLLDPDTIISSDFVASTMGPAISLEFVLIAMLLIASAGVSLGYLTHVARRTIMQSVRLEVTNAQFGRYFSPGVVSRIANDADTVPGVGGRAQDVAVMFCDMRDFTTLTETMSPSDVVGFLSQYHARMVEVIFAHGGTIDKFIGDAIMVTFGTPDPGDDDAERAVRAGLAMNQALADFNQDRAVHGLGQIKHGIGIHFGTVIAGNIGTEKRLEYTVIGDAVNVASRIEGLCKSVGESLLISEAVKARLPSDIKVRPLPEQRVKGRQSPVLVFAVDQ